MLMPPSGSSSDVQSAANTWGIPSCRSASRCRSSPRTRSRPSPTPPTRSC
ncbi:hypothetical protein ACFP7B_05105 [Sanguibacter inulinus]